MRLRISVEGAGGAVAVALQKVRIVPAPRAGEHAQVRIGVDSPSERLPIATVGVDAPQVAQRVTHGSEIWVPAAERVRDGTPRRVEGIAPQGILLDRRGLVLRCATTVDFGIIGPLVCEVLRILLLMALAARGAVIVRAALLLPTARVKPIGEALLAALSITKRNVMDPISQCFHSLRKLRLLNDNATVRCTALEPAFIDMHCRIPCFC